MKTNKVYNGVVITLVSGKKEKRIKNGHGCMVLVDRISFRSQYKAKKFIDALGGSHD